MSGLRKDGILQTDDVGPAIPITGDVDAVITSIADGVDVTQGAIADAAVITDTSGTISGKLRGLVKWAFERMPASLGQKLSSASLSVVIASDQSIIQQALNYNTYTVTHGVIPDGTSEVTLLAANTNRKAAIILNNSTAVLVYKYGTGIVGTGFSGIIPASGSVTLQPGYRGIITGLWAADTAGGTAFTSEFV